MPITLAPAATAEDAPPVTETLDAGESIVQSPVIVQQPIAPELPKNEISGAEVIAAMLVLLLLYGMIRAIFAMLPYIIAIGLSVVAFKLFF